MIRKIIVTIAIIFSVLYGMVYGLDIVETNNVKFSGNFSMSNQPITNFSYLGYYTIAGVTNLSQGIMFLNTTGYLYTAWQTNANGSTRTNLWPLF